MKEVYLVTKELHSVTRPSDVFVAVFDNEDSALRNARILVAKILREYRSDKHETFNYDKGNRWWRIWPVDNYDDTEVSVTKAEVWS